VEKLSDLLQWRWSTMTRNDNLRNGLSMKEFGCVLAELVVQLLSSFESPVLPRLRGSLGLLDVAIEKLTQLATRLFSPMRQTHAVSGALVCVGSEALAVAHLRWAFAHVHFTEVEIFVWIHSTVAVAEEVLLLELVALGEDFLFTVEAVLRPLWVFVGLSGAGSQSPHAPAVSELPHLTFRHVDARPRRQVIAPHVVVISAQSTEFILVADRRFHLQKVVAVPSEFDAKMRLNHDFIVLILVNFDDFLDDVWQLNARAVHLHAQLLTEVDFDVFHLESDGLGPAGMFGLSGVVGYANRECVIDTVGRQLVLAGALKAEELPVECLVVRIAKHCADA
jgi:hypothetical protein